MKKKPPLSFPMRLGMSHTERHFSERFGRFIVVPTSIHMNSFGIRKIVTGPDSDYVGDYVPGPFMSYKEAIKKAKTINRKVRKNRYKKRRNRK